eukprot:5382782-Amphidinium_carterae.1
MSKTLVRPWLGCLPRTEPASPPGTEALRSRSPVVSAARTAASWQGRSGASGGSPPGTCPRCRLAGGGERPPVPLVWRHHVGTTLQRETAP